MKLHLSKNSIGVEGARALAEALKYHRVRESPPLALLTHSAFLSEKGLHELYLNDNNIGDEGARLLTVALAQHKVRGSQRSCRSTHSNIFLYKGSHRTVSQQQYYGRRRHQGTCCGADKAQGERIDTLSSILSMGFPAQQRIWPNWASPATIWASTALEYLLRF